VAGIAERPIGGYGGMRAGYLLGRLDSLDQFGVAAAVAADLVFGPGGPPTVTQIPYAWLTPPIPFRPDAPYTAAAVTRTSGGTAYASDSNSLAEYGSTEYTATLATLGTQDTASLAAYIVDYYATQPGKVPRQRIPALVINLMPLDPVSVQRVLGLQVGRRIHISGTPGESSVLTTNTSFEAGLTDWTSTGAGTTITQSSANAHGGTASMLITPPGAVATVGAQTATHYPIVVGANYVAAGWFLAPNGWSDVRPCIDWYDSTNTFLSSGLGSAFTLTAGTWSYLSQTLAAPTGAAFAVARARVGSTPSATDLVYVDDYTMTGPSPTMGGWPEGTTDLVIEGISDTIGLNVRTRSLRTSPVIGSTPGTVGPWFRFDTSTLGGTDLMPF